MEWITDIFGTHRAGIWIGTIFWTLIILIVYKLRKARKKGVTLKAKYFLNDNLYDMLINVLLAAIMLRGGDELIRAISKLVSEKVLMPMFDIELTGEGMDVVILVSLLVLPFSFLIHKKVDNPVSKRMAAEMHQKNNE